MKILSWCDADAELPLKIPTAGGAAFSCGREEKRGHF